MFRSPYHSPMNPKLGWLLAVLAVGIGWKLYGWPGVVMAVTVTTFWLLLQFSRALRAMKNAGRAAVGRVASAVMLNARLRPGMTMLQVIALTRSLGSKVDDSGDVWRWHDDGDCRVTLTFAGGKLQRWELQRRESQRPLTGTAGDDAAGPAP